MSLVIPSARLAGFGFELPGARISLADFLKNPEARDRLAATGQKFTYVADNDSTSLAIAAGARALAVSATDPGEVGLVISAPSLLTSYGLEIPAVAARAQLGLRDADCMNVSQGCVGVLIGLRLAANHVATSGGAALVLVGCMASTITHDMSHGAFFWGDGGGAVVVRADAGPGPRLIGYAEASADSDWGAMHVPYGDRLGLSNGRHKIAVEFPDARARANYVSGERRRFRQVLGQLLSESSLQVPDLEALFLPSTGRNRAASLLNNDSELEARLATDFEWPHLGGIDVLLFLERYLQQRSIVGDGWYALLSPAFAAQWAGVLLKG